MISPKLMVLTSIALGGVVLGAWIGTAKDSPPSPVTPPNTLEDAFQGIKSVAPPLDKTHKPVITERDDAFPLQLGSRGHRVERLKVWLMRNFGAQGPLNNSFDAATLERVQRHLKTSQVSKELYERHHMGRHVQEQKIVR